jgi:PAS domain S-box-containing protein
MDFWFGGPVAAVAAVALAAGVAAILLSLAAVGALRRMLRRTTARIRDLRRHPLVGDLPAETEPSLRELARELNLLLADLRAAARRLEERRLLPAIAGGPPDLAIIGLDGEYAVASFSRGAALLTGWEPVEILDRHVEVLFAPGEWERLLPKLARRTLREGGIAETVRLLCRDGRVLPARVSMAGAAPDGSGGLILVARDLTEEQEAGGRLRASEKRYRGLVEGIADGVFLVEEERIVHANPALARMLGREPERLRGTPFCDLVHAHDLLRVVEILRRAARDEEPAGETICLLAARDGSPLEVRLAWAAAGSAGRRAVAGTVVDLGARARFERALAESQARLQATLEASGDGLLVLEPGADGALVTLVNRAFAERFGLSAGELQGRPEGHLVAVIGPRCAEPGGFGALLERARADGEARAEGLEIIAPRRALVDLLAGPVRSTSGGTLGLIVTLRDVTARLDGERELRRSHDELARAKTDLEAAYRGLAEAQKALAQRNDQLERLNAELRSLDEMKSNLLANVSHELHTPLVSIKGYTEMILKRKLGPLTPEQERGLGVALRNIDRLVEMIDNLLSFSRMEKGETRLRLEDAPFWQLVDEAIEMVGERVRKKNLQVTTQYETDDLVVRCDRGKIGQVLVNLLTNAVKFNREGGRITIAARRGETGFLEVDVADTGVGIPEDALDKIFERFYQVDGSPSRRYEGTGIGLSIVRDILRLHGCSIRVRSEVGKGSVFTITLPLARSPQPSPGRPPAVGRDRGRAGA